ncbi:predicted protein [Chaetoceros tenuissimus]|uniref:Uncharacterized protein n=1 Tax=Chaetoceros tenuissimus TaxID=426638 RepID=A0AAD3CWP5_9STRA|nr:predicted protein [Chaetoceros tenuissimus]
MSLAAQFSKKKIKRRQRVGLSIIQADGEKKSLSLNNDQRKENQIQEIDRDITNDQNDAKRDNTFSFDFKEAIEATTAKEDMKNESGNQKTQFSFGFEFKEESQKDSKEVTISKSKKRRNRKKKKKKHDLIETDQSIKERSNSMKPPPGLSSPDPQRKSLFDSLRTPPGFDRSVLYNQNRIRKTPGSHTNGSNNHESFLHFDNTTKGLAFVNHNSLSARHDRTSVQNSSFFNSDPFSFGFAESSTQQSSTVETEDIGTEAVNIKFNKASNLAFVNQNSLAVRQERTEAKRSNQEHDPFSFGFSLDTLLKDYL